ncbi:MAG: hypothetical protein EOP04_32285, partial [Proteobacteria bacterium]
SFQSQFNLFKSIFQDTKNIFKCGGSAPNPSFGDRWNVNIQNAAHGQFCLNAQSYANESPNNIYGCASHPDQKWNIRSAEGEYKHVQSNKFQVCLNLQDSYDYKETNLYQCNLHQDQEWKVRTTSNGQVMFESRRAPGKCLAINQAYNEARTVIKGCYDEDYTQRWNVY